MSTSPQATVSADELSEIRWLDPKLLAANPANARTELRDLEELTASITLMGVVEPLIVIADSDGYRILAGHRRAAAAILAGADAVPCWLRPDLESDGGDELAAALVENIQRDALTPLEEASAYAQLAAFPSWSVERIAKAAGRPADEVRRRVEVTQLPEHLRQTAINSSLTLDQARQIEEFAGDKATYNRLVRHAGERGFAHLLSRAQRDRETARRLDESRCALEAAGIPIVERPGYRSVAVALDDLYDSEGNSLGPDDDDAHRRCPGHAAYLDSYTGNVGYVCVEPRAYGHSTPPWYKHMSEADAAAWAAEEEAAREHAAALEAAGDVRRNFVRERIAAKGKVPAGTLRVATQTIFDPDQSVDVDDFRDDVAWFLGHDDPETIDVDEAISSTLAKTADARLALVLLALAAAIAEKNVAAHDQWSYSRETTLRWFAFLATLGYSTTDAENALLTEAPDDDSQDGKHSARLATCG